MSTPIQNLIVAGLILASLMNAGQPTAGRGFELVVIASVILGGTSLSGGRGTLIGTLLGVLVLKVIDNGAEIMVGPRVSNGDTLCDGFDFGTGSLESSLVAKAAKCKPGVSVFSP